MEQHMDHTGTKHRHLSKQRHGKTLYNLNKKLDRLTRQQKKETKQTYHNDENQFHERTLNLTTIKFDKEEKILIDKGMQYSIEKPIGIYWNDIIIETEQAIKKLEPRLQEAYRITAAQKLNKMKNSTSRRNKEAQRQNQIINNIKKKLIQGNATMAKADKGKTIVIINNTEYNKKTLDFINTNEIMKLTKDPTKTFHKK